MGVAQDRSGAVSRPASGGTLGKLVNHSGAARPFTARRSLFAASVPDMPAALRVQILGSIWLLAVAGAAVAQPSRPPNVIVLLADDLGAHDLACQGADLHETPHLDRLAAQGLRFTQAYAMSVCTPTRAAIQTGKHAARLGMTIWREGSFPDGKPAKTRLLPADAEHDLPLAEVTLAEMLKPHGYVTLHVGKWHLGDADHAPESHGFDVNIGGTHWGAPQSFFWPFRGSREFNEFRYVPGLGIGREGDHLCDRLTDEALRLIDEAGDRPFFLNLCYHDPHTPIEARPELVEKYRARLRPGMRHQNAAYAAMLQTLDENVGRLLAHLDQRRLSANTLVIFTSDNGGYIGKYRGTNVTDNGPLRSGKGALYEGGIRVPLLVRLPGRTLPGSVCHEPVICMDLLPTIAELAESTAPAALDGLSLKPLMADPLSRLPREALYFHYPHYYHTTTPASAVRAGDWKLIEFFEDGRRELYNLRDDPSEAHDLASDRPAERQRLSEQLVAWRTSVAARLPRPNPAFGNKP